MDSDPHIHLQPPRFARTSERRPNVPEAFVGFSLAGNAVSSRQTGTPEVSPSIASKFPIRVAIALPTVNDLLVTHCNSSAEHSAPQSDRHVTQSCTSVSLRTTQLARHRSTPLVYVPAWGRGTHSSALLGPPWICE